VPGDLGGDPGAGPGGIGAPAAPARTAERSPSRQSRTRCSTGSACRPGGSPPHVHLTCGNPATQRSRRPRLARQVHRLRGDPDDLAGLPVRAHRHQHPRVWASRSLVVRSATAAAAGFTRYRARESTVRHFPSAPCTRLRNPLWMCSCGSCSRESCWKKLATTPVRGVDPPTRAAPVLPDPRVARVRVQVRQAGVVPGRDRVLDRPTELTARRGPIGVTIALRGDLLGLDRGVQQRDRLRDTERHIEERHVLPRVFPRLQPQLAAGRRGGGGRRGAEDRVGTPSSPLSPKWAWSGFGLRLLLLVGDR
jgi:hypothetical protein